MKPGIRTEKRPDLTDTGKVICGLNYTDRVTLSLLINGPSIMKCLFRADTAVRRVSLKTIFLASYKSRFVLVPLPTGRGKAHPREALRKEASPSEVFYSMRRSLSVIVSPGCLTMKRPSSKGPPESRSTRKVLEAS